MLAPLLRYWAVNPADPSLAAMDETIVRAGLSPSSLTAFMRKVGSASVEEMRRAERVALQSFARDGGFRRFPDLWVREALGEWPWSKQTEILRALAAHRKVAVHSGHGVGKAVSWSMRIPTPTGWSEMGDLAIGDQVFSEDGRPINVTGVRRWTNRPCYRVTFDDNSSVVVDAEHEWTVQDLTKRKKVTGWRKVSLDDWRDEWDKLEVVTTAEMATNVLFGVQKQRRWRVPTTRPLDIPGGAEPPAPVELPDIELCRACEGPMDRSATTKGKACSPKCAASLRKSGGRSDEPGVFPPYAAGVWFGDGTTPFACFTSHEADLSHYRRALAAEGFWLHQRNEKPGKNGATWRVAMSHVSNAPLLPWFRDSGLCCDPAVGKRIPVWMLRASQSYRLALLRGVMDTDGFLMGSTSERSLMVGCDLASAGLAGDVAELVRSLGWKAFRRTKVIQVNGEPYNVYRLNFTPDVCPFTLPRKAEPWRFVHESGPGQRSRHTLHTIVSIEPVPNEKTVCIEVDSPRHLYLLGENMVPTHNSYIASRAVLWWLSTFDDALALSTAPTGAQVRSILWREIRAGHRKGRLRGHMNQVEWLSDEGDVIGMGRKPADTDEHAFQGLHAERVLVVLDEAGGVPETLFEDSEKIVTTEGSRILAVGNPTHEGSYWWQVCAGRIPDWHVIHVSSMDTPNFTDEQASTPDDVLRHVTPRLWVDEQRRRYGENSVRFRQQVLGQFTRERAMTVIPVQWAQAAASGVVATVDPESRPLVRLGVDVGATGDWFLIRAMHGNRVGKLWRDVSGQAGAQADMVVRAAAEVGASEVCLDVAGVGYGLPDLIRDRNPNLVVVPVDASEKSCVVRLPDGQTVYRWAIPSGVKPDQVREEFANRRAELWWAGRERCMLAADPSYRPVVPYVREAWDLSALEDQASIDVWLGEGESDPTMDELCAPGYMHKPRALGEVIQVESKDELRKATRLGHSTDHADALLLAQYPHPHREVAPLRTRAVARQARRPAWSPPAYRASGR